jgi:DNA polymerase-3 subunit alpha
MHGFADYFLIVADYVQWAKDHKIYIGPGRGSVCNCQVAWALGITDVDSLRFDLDFRRFLREDKKKLPDIDLDFETSRRQEVIDYLIQKYHGHSAQVCSYGLYKVDNLVNDLAKVCGVEEKEEIKEIKDFIKRCFASEEFNFELAKKQPEFKSLNKKYDNIIVHFARLFKKMRFIGTHAAGVAITGGDIKNYCAIKITKEGREYTVYDLADLDIVHVVKFDMLGLKTMESIGELRELTGNEGLIDEMYEDPNILEEFKNGNTDGIFQFESGTAKSILKNIQCDCFEDIVAASSMNRPGPLSTHMPEQYAVNKFNIESAKQSEYYKYTKSTYGTVVYQEQIQQICVEFAGMSWSDSDRVMKLMKNAIASMGELKQINEDKKKYTEMFAENVYKLHGMNKQKAEEMFKSVLTYTFNKGHGVGYGMISLEEMYYRVYYPTEFWYVKLKYAGDDGDLFKFSNCAVANGTLIFLPHVNYTADYSIRKVDGEQVIQAGLVSIKGVGGKAAAFIEYERKKHGPYSSKEDFIERCKIKGSPVNKGVVEKLIEEGALEFSKKTYLKRVTKYNSTLYMKGMQKNG